MRLRVVLGVVGQLLRLYCLAFVLPLLLALVDGAVESAVRFAVAGLSTFALGSLLGLGFQRGVQLYRAEALGVVALSWLGIALAGSQPYLLYGLHWANAFFESMSGFTTTGATILVDFSAYDRAFFLWRSMSQWFGGLGVIALFIVVLPRLGIAGRQLFFAEVSGTRSEAVSPQARKSSRQLLTIYTALTLTLTVVLMGVCDFSWFDALNHALTTISAGGFSPSDTSLAGVANPRAEWVVTTFMVLAGASFALQYRAFTRRPLALLADAEFRFYFGLLVGLSLLLSVLLARGVPAEEQLRIAAFQVASLMSGTGFASVDYNLWHDAARVVLIVAMLLGGCAGSAAGGPKAVRLLLVWKHVSREFVAVLHPRAVQAIRYHGHPVSRDVMRSVFMLVVLYALTHFTVGVVLVLMGSDLVLGFTAAAACVGNVGPAFGPAGPMGNFDGFSPAVKVVLALAMWVGRLEIVTVLALFHPEVLRGLTWRGR